MAVRQENVGWADLSEVLFYSLPRILVHNWRRLWKHSPRRCTTATAIALACPIYFCFDSRPV